MRKNINKNYKSPNSTIYSEKNKDTFLTDNVDIKPQSSRFIELKQSVVSNSSMPNASNTLDKYTYDSRYHLAEFDNELNELANQKGNQKTIFKDKDGLISPNIINFNKMTKSITSPENTFQSKPRSEILGPPSGRKEVELMEEWLKYMVDKYLNVDCDDMSDDLRIRRAQLI